LEQGQVSADKSGWLQLSAAEEAFLAAKHSRTRLAVAAEMKSYCQTGRLAKGKGDFPPGVLEQLAMVIETDIADLDAFSGLVARRGGTVPKFSKMGIPFTDPSSARHRGHPPAVTHGLPRCPAMEARVPRGHRRRRTWSWPAFSSPNRSFIAWNVSG
jgi:hypothetical protein